MKNIFEKINFKQPKYMLPAILYIPLLALEAAKRDGEPKFPGQIPCPRPGRRNHTCHFE